MQGFFIPLYYVFNNLSVPSIYSEVLALGSKEDPLSSIMIRFPNGNRVTKEIPCSSQFLAIVEYVKSEGFDLDKYKIVTNFPRRILTDLDTKQTLKEMGLFPKEMVIVQKNW